MVQRILVTVLVCCGMAWAQPATQPATQPTTRDAFPAPAEVFEQMKQRRAEEMAKTKIAYIDLAEPVTERPPSFSLLALSDSNTLPRGRLVFFDCQCPPARRPALPSTPKIGTALRKVKSAGK